MMRDLAGEHLAAGVWPLAGEWKDIPNPVEWPGNPILWIPSDGWDDPVLTLALVDRDTDALVGQMNTIEWGEGRAALSDNGRLRMLDTLGVSYAEFLEPLAKESRKCATDGSASAACKKQ
ncbi:hypothetical protein ACP70R_040013 [Stipagrostis hirtigluma subsp. patula]